MGDRSDVDQAVSRAVARIWARPTPARPHIEWWIWAAPVVGVIHLAILAALEARLGRIGVVLWAVGPPVVIVMVAGLLLGALLASARRRDGITRWRLAGYGVLFAVGATLPVWQAYPSSYDSRPSAVRFRLPLDGPVTVAWGGASRRVNYHAALSDQRWAYDLLVTRDGRSHAGRGLRLDEYLAYGQPVRAPADGVVRAVHDGEPDREIGESASGRLAAGNHLVVEVATGQYLVIAHLQPGTMTVQAGDRVSAGQALGLVGNSGNSSEPHVHLHLQDTLALSVGEGIPFFFHDFERAGRVVERGMPRGGVRRGRFTGEIVTHVWR